MKELLDFLTAHLKEEAKSRASTFAEQEVESIYQKLRKEFLNEFFKKIAIKNNARYETFVEEKDYVRLAMYFGKNYISNFKLYPFHVEVDESFDIRPTKEHLTEVEMTWINQLSESLGDDYDDALQAFEDRKLIKPE